MIIRLLSFSCPANKIKGLRILSNGISRKGFDIDLAEAQSREGTLAQILTGAKVELKTDYQAQETGNVFVEYSYGGSPSGIAVTTAEYWCFEIPQKCYLLVRTERLKELAREAFKKGLRVKGGDYDRALGVLIPISALWGGIGSALRCGNGLGWQRLPKVGKMINLSQGGVSQGEYSLLELL